MLKRIKENPIIAPNEKNDWEAIATFNPCVIKDKKKFHMLYRAMSLPYNYHDVNMSVSTIGHAESSDGLHFKNRKQLIKPEQDWEKFGCEDPRITKLEDNYYIFYTALSSHPFSAQNIKVGVAITKDLHKIDEKYLVTPFNAKAMALFPEKINGKIAAILTADTDTPPAKIALAFFNKETDIWSEKYWREWYVNIDANIIPLLRTSRDHLEVGAPPIKTKDGWLIIYSYIKNYFSSAKKFTIEAALLDLNNPLKIIGRTGDLLAPKSTYELKGNVANIAFPSGALIQDNELWVYYGGADTTCCLATINLEKLLKPLIHKEKAVFVTSKKIEYGFKRYNKNPIITPRPELSWEGDSILNPAAFYLNNGVHIVYRAFSNDNVSVLGYAFSKDGVHIDERLTTPIYVPREPFERAEKPNYSGCEDPRITIIDNNIYMLYTAYDGYVPRVAFTSIKTKDFLQRKWNWQKPVIISRPDIGDKNSCLFPEKVNGKYVILHREDSNIYLDMFDDLNFAANSKKLSDNNPLMLPRKDKWDNRKIGATSQPIKTKQGWLLLYHGCSDPGRIYKVGAALLDLNSPNYVIARTDIPVFEPEMDYEQNGLVPNVVFPCGNVVINNYVYLYYGGADTVVGVARIALNKLLQVFKM
jgi:predicted GH43/DUF377 family glycosyl hydrolase